MAERAGPAVYTIPPHRAFADALAAGLIRQFGASPMRLARGVVLVPSNRARAAINDAFVRRAEQGLLLPRLVTVGGEDLDDALGARFDPIDGEPLPPAIEPIPRQLILARLVQEARSRSGRAVDGAEAMRLAADLARVLDQLHFEQVPPARLRALDVRDELSEHWQASLAELSVILDRWPEELARLGRIDLAERRNLLLTRAARGLEMAPPEGFVVAAGVTTSARAVAALLHRVARLPRGMVVLPGLDLAMPDDEWDAIGAEAIETHPQFHLRLLLDRMGVARGEVGTWRWGGGHDAAAARSRTISNAFAPARFTGKWSDLDPAERRLGGIAAIECANPAEEAQAIALALREALETPGQTAALVTPDRALARRVAAHLARWDITADDTAGEPLSATPPGALLLALAAAAAEGFAPVALLTLLKHPLVRFGEARLAWMDGARALDLALRGPRPGPGLAAIGDYLAKGDWPAAADWWREARPLLDPLEGAFAAERLTIAEALGALREAATRLAGDETWSGPAGRAAADLLAAVEGATDGPRAIEQSAVGPMLRDLMQSVAVRPPQGGHPRIAIRGLIEARLQQADVVVLGGLNEGVWPALPPPDAWLAPRARVELGLPALERRIGLAAHDLASGLGAARVLLTRARRDASAPTIASRFWLRLETLAGELPAPPTRYDLLARGIDASAERPRRAARPAPAPPIAERPRKLSVTDVDRLSADPYAFYAKKMLGLAALEAVDVDPGPAWRGSLVHDVLDHWLKQDGCAPGTLAARMDAALQASGVHPVLRALWEPRFAGAARWIEAQVAANRAEGRMPLLAEEYATVELAGVRLGGKIDRLDRLADGSLAIVDYKTGEPPSDKQVSAGLALQLGLLGHIAEESGFGGEKARAAAFEYWSLARDRKTRNFGFLHTPVGEKGNKVPVEAFVDKAVRAFTAAAARWLTGDAPFEAKLHPDYAWSDYDHLMRLEEWQGRDG